ncbi:MAG: glucose-6-phosphate isomerase, partial [Clostridia bacterium]|nr:glucose-6-phosphate isomerase [Clostridia bacterium]
MANWKNLDTLKAYDELLELRNEVEVREALAGENGAKRVAEYNVPIAEGLTFNYAARPVNEKVLKTLQALADEAELTEKYAELYNGAVINTGEKRLVLHQLCRGQLGEDV